MKTFLGSSYAQGQSALYSGQIWHITHRCHPADWTDSGYREIQAPRKKLAIIDYQNLAEKAGFRSYETFKKAHAEWVNEALANGCLARQQEWTESIAVGGEEFTAEIKGKLGIRAKGANDFSLFIIILWSSRCYLWRPLRVTSSNNRKLFPCYICYIKYTSDVYLCYSRLGKWCIIGIAEYRDELAWRYSVIAAQPTWSLYSFKFD